MSGDSASKNEEELVSQIDELKARMDRLMSGGSSTSNSALLTEKPEATPAPPPPVAPPPAPERTRVRDLVETGDTEVIEVYPGPKEVVPFPSKDGSAAAEAETPVDDEPVARSEHTPGSVISVEEEEKEERPQVASFDDLGSAIQHELARDESIPPAEAKKGPDLASRFGPVDGPSAPAAEGEEPAEDDETESPEVAEEPEATIDDEEPEVEVRPLARDNRSAFGKVAAIWALTAVASGAIAALHFMGVI